MCNVPPKFLPSTGVSAAWHSPWHPTTTTVSLYSKQNMNSSPDISSVLKCLTMKDIKDALPNHTFSNAEKRSRVKLEEAVSQLPETHQALLRHVAHTKEMQKRGSRTTKTTDRYDTNLFQLVNVNSHTSAAKGPLTLLHS